MNAVADALTRRALSAREGERARALLHGRADDPAWVRPTLIALLAATAALYLADLAASGYANSFYSAAVEAGTKSWKAFLFGSFDSSNFITVDKPPAALWVMELSARLFGVSSWSILVPQALEGVAAVALLYAAVRRRFGAPAGLLAGAVLALTPVAALMFRFNNPDALLTLLTVAAAYALVRALEDARTAWLVLTGVLLGVGFLTKMLQVLTVVPGFAAVYLLAAPASFWRRMWQLLAGGAAMVGAAAWWVAIVALWPASSRPYIGGSQDNSILNLIFGYNGFGRLTGNETGSVIGGQVFGQTGGGAGAGAGGGSMWGPTGITRLFGAEMGTQIAWLLPAALFFLVELLAGMWRVRRTDGRRASVLIWGSWLVVTGAVFSFSQGIIHPYYNVILAPAAGALVGIGVAWAWQRRASLVHRFVLAVAVAGTGTWAFVLLDRTPGWHPALRYAVLVVGCVAAVAVAAGPVVWGANAPVRRAVLLVALVALLAAPAAYSLQTAVTAHAGSLPSAGPAGAISGPGAGPGGRRGLAPGQAQATRPGQAGTAQTGTGQIGAAPPAGAGLGTPPAGFAPGGFNAGRGVGFGRAGGLGGLLDAATPSAALVELLEADASSYSWVAAVVGSNSAAGFQLATGEPVMAIGGFNGTDPWPSLGAFRQLVAQGKVHYFIASGGGGGPGGGIGSSSSSEAVASWVESHFTATTVGGVTVYDLSR